MVGDRHYGSRHLSPSGRAGLHLAGNGENSTRHASPSVRVRSLSGEKRAEEEILPQTLSPMRHSM